MNTMFKGTKIIARRAPMEFGGDDISLYVFAINGERRVIPEPVIFKEHEQYTTIEPLFKVDKHMAQELMDSLWECGLRPSEGTGSSGAMAATQKHLEDMRTLVFKQGRC